MDDSSSIAMLVSLLSNIPDLELAVLVGSRAHDTANSISDWDIAVRWDNNIIPWEKLSRTETLRRELAQQLGVTEDKIDLIDLAAANLSMRAVVAEEGVVLKGENDLAWIHFLTRTWRELEDYYWEQSHAA